MLLRTAIVLCLFSTNLQQLPAQDFMMQAWFWDYPKPVNPMGDPNMESTWAKTLINQVPALGSAGFTYLWIPPASRASFGSFSNGYDPKDLYDLGEFGQGATGFGFRQDVDNLVIALGAAGMEGIADVVYNHRDGGSPEHNPAVQSYVTDAYGDPNSENPFPSDRFRCVLPLGGSSGNGAGDYYIKISSKTGASRFHNFAYRLYLETDVVGWQGLADTMEVEPNGGGNCGEANNSVTLGRNVNAQVDAAGCTVDEFHINLSGSDFNAAGDYLYIYINNTGDYSDHRPFSIWNASAGLDVAGQLEYQTYTDFSSLPSGRGGMNYSEFRPSSSGAAYGETLAGEWNTMYFFYDYDQSQQDLRDTLYEWSEWLWDDVGIRGFRMDAVKHFDYSFVGDLLDQMHDSGKDPGMVVGEFFDTNPGVLQNWINNVEGSMDNDTKSAIDIRAFDFGLRHALKDACDAFGYDVRNVFHAGMVKSAGSDPFNVVTFVNNHDYRTASESVANDPMLAYAYILTNNQVGLPCVFYPDYYGVDLTPDYPLVNLKDEIDQLMSIHQDYIYQSIADIPLSDFGSPYSAFYVGGYPNTTLSYQLTGGIAGKEVVVVINFAGEDLDVYQKIDMTNVPSGEYFSDLTGNATNPLITVNANQELHLEIPARSYAVFVQGELILPAELLAFSAKAQKKDVLLSWKSATEIQLDKYVVQRSRDGRQFTDIAKLTAEGSNSVYAYTDASPGAGLWYYRLKMVDTDGSVNFSEMESLQFGQEIFEVKVYPNPAKEELFVQFETNKTNSIIWEVLDINGRLIQSGETEVNAGINAFKVPVNGVASGVYYLRLQSQRGNPEIFRFMKTD